MNDKKSRRTNEKIKWRTPGRKALFLIFAILNFVFFFRLGRIAYGGDEDAVALMKCFRLSGLREEITVFCATIKPHPAQSSNRNWAPSTLRTRFTRLTVASDSCCVRNCHTYSPLLYSSLIFYIFNFIRWQIVNALQIETIERWRITILSRIAHHTRMCEKRKKEFNTRTMTGSTEIMKCDHTSHTQVLCLFGHLMSLSLKKIIIINKNCSDSICLPKNMICNSFQSFCFGTGILEKIPFAEIRCGRANRTAASPKHTKPKIIIILRLIKKSLWTQQRTNEVVFLVRYPIWDWVSVIRCVHTWPECRSLFIRFERIGCCCRACVCVCSRRRHESLALCACSRSATVQVKHFWVSYIHSHRSIYTYAGRVLLACVSIRWHTRAPAEMLVCKIIIYWLVLVSPHHASCTVATFFFSLTLDHNCKKTLPTNVNVNAFNGDHSVVTHANDECNRWQIHEENAKCISDVK